MWYTLSFFPGSPVFRLIINEPQNPTHLPGGKRYIKEEEFLGLGPVKMLFLNILTRCERVHKMNEAATYPIVSVLGFRLVLNLFLSDFGLERNQKGGSVSTTRVSGWA